MSVYRKPGEVPEYPRAEAYGDFAVAFGPENHTVPFVAEAEAPCEVTKAGCVWMNEDVSDDPEDGWFTFCIECGRTRDYAKREYEEPPCKLT